MESAVKVVLLAGGRGTRINEESMYRPKPMVEVGGKPLLWHIMKIYSSYGFNDFVICIGYKGYYIKEYFSNYFLHVSDVTFDLRDNNKLIVHRNTAEPWRITLVDTGLDTLTGGRLRRVKEYVEDETFMLTYGDGVSNINLSNLLEFHREHKKTVTMSVVNPMGRFGVPKLEGNTVTNFLEKPESENSWINGGFFVMEPGIFEYLEGDTTILERAPLENLAKNRELMAFKHKDFWYAADTLRDINHLEALWASPNCPWKLWD